MSEYSDSSDLINGVVKGLEYAHTAVLTDALQRRARDHERVLSDQAPANEALQIENAYAQGKLRGQESKISWLDRENKDLKKQLELLEKEQKEIQTFMAKPLSELFSDYKKLGEQLEEWAISQKTFRELTYTYSELLHKKDEEVEADYKKMEKSVRYLRAVRKMK